MWIMSGASESESESDKSGETQLRNCEKHVAAQMPNTGWFFSLVPPKKLKYGKPRLGESTLA